jgi:hypothetical protein
MEDDIILAYHQRNDTQPAHWGAGQTVACPFVISKNPGRNQKGGASPEANQVLVCRIVRLSGLREFHAGKRA